MKQIILNKLTALFVVLSFFACTDLEIESTDSIIDNSGSSGSVFSGVEDVDASVTNVYNGFNRLGDQANYHALQEVASDELLVPTRGTDWGDNGIWRTLHNHTWSPSHQYVLNVWNNWNQSIFQAGEVLDSRSNANSENFAHASFLRAFSMWIVLDMFGQVPFREPDEGPEVNPKVLSRIEALDLVLSDLDTAIADLPTVSAGDVENQKRASKASARFLKARVLLNAHIYRGDAQAASADMQEVISLVDAIAADGYALQEGFFDIFKESADTETIWWLPTGVGNRIWNGLHYHQQSEDNTGGGWNGFSTLAEFYEAFEGPADNNALNAGQEERRGWVPDANTTNATNGGIGYGFLVGQQYDASGSPLKDRAGNPLVFSKELPGLVGNDEKTGIRTIKYHPVDGSGSFRSHEIIFRYADAHLMKAEAMMRSGGDATVLVNELRTLRNATSLSNVSESDLLAERGRELYKEQIRRTDMIRFGEFTRNWEFKNPASVDDTTKNLFPIPSSALLSNPNLTQNAGY
jgi:hypothetical protein